MTRHQRKVRAPTREYAGEATIDDTEIHQGDMDIHIDDRSNAEKFIGFGRRSKRGAGAHTLRMDF